MWQVGLDKELRTKRNYILVVLTYLHSEYLGQSMRDGTEIRCIQGGGLRLA